MKVTILILLVATLVLPACSGLKEDKMKSFIPGMYIRKVHNEFTDGWDTLVIKQQDHAAGIYFIDKMETYQKHLDGKTFPPEHKEEEWTAVYDEKLHQLFVQNKERVLLFDPEKNLLYMNRTAYDKVEN